MGGGLPEVMTSANNFTLVAPLISNPHVYVCCGLHVLANAFFF